MAQADLADFFKAASADQALLEQFKSSPTPEAMIQVASQAGFAVTAEDLQALASQVEASASAQELDDEALAGVTGGFALSFVGGQFGYESIGQAADDLIGAVVGQFAPQFKSAYDSLNNAI